MNNRDGDIISTETLEPNKYIISTVKRMYDIRVIENTIVEHITYLSDGLKIKGFVARPAEPGVYPVLLWNRGGSGDRGAIDNLTAYLILASTALWGYVVVASQYRGNKGSEGSDDWGGGDLTDSLNMLEVARQYPECDLERVAVEGASRGGMVTYRELTMRDDFKCAIIHAGITDVVRLCQEKTGFRRYLNEQFKGLCTEDKEAELRRRSAVGFASDFPKNTPILIMHGTDDKVVPIEQSQVLATELTRRGIPHEFKIIEGGGHVALKDGTYKEIDILRKEWLRRHLKAGTG